MSASSASSLGTEALVPGTELIVDRLVYRHHGIYLGEGLVIHYAGRIRHLHGLIEAVPMRTFAGKRRVQVGRRPAEPLHGEAIVNRARSRLGERRYAVLSNNCEHFCSWCQVGESRSEQVNGLLQRIGAVKCAVCCVLPRRRQSQRKSGHVLAFPLKSVAAKWLPRISTAASTAPGVCDSRGITGRGR